MHTHKHTHTHTQTPARAAAFVCELSLKGYKSAADEKVQQCNQKKKKSTGVKDDDVNIIILLSGVQDSPELLIGINNNRIP